MKGLEKVRRGWGNVGVREGLEEVWGNVGIREG